MAKSKGVESLIIYKAFKINEIIENKMKDFKINSTIVRNLVVKHIQELEKQQRKQKSLM